jgi:carbon monoxide dehydrogenase subunit G
VSIDIARPRQEVFAYVTDPSRFAEWQAGVVGGHMEDGEATTVGSKCMTTRRIGKLLVPLVVRRQARNEMPANIQRLKERLEAPAH